MKTETQIAKENLQLYKGFHITFKALTQHKESCERFLDWIKKERGYTNEYSNIFDDKVKDLKQTIKLYEEKGI